MLPIGPYQLKNRFILAPMAGVSEMPFRVLAFEQGAALAPTELISAQGLFRINTRTLRYLRYNPQVERPYSLQLFGGEPEVMAQAAVIAKQYGAQIIDINMGCPAKKVCNKWAGSALMQDEPLALEIVQAVVAACAPHNVPVTLKMRTGWSQENKNAVRIARAAEAAGVAMLTVHGRTREQGYKGQAEYDTIAAVKAAVKVPVVANGDITSPEKAHAVLAYTGADAIMIGRAAQGRPWIFGDIAHYLATGQHRAAPLTQQVKQWLLDHLDDHYSLYGEFAGVRTARKHIGWAVRALPGGEDFRAHMNTLETCASQVQAVADFFDALSVEHDRLPLVNTALEDDEAAQDAREAACTAN